MRNCHPEEKEVSVSGKQMIVSKGPTLSENSQYHNNILKCFLSLSSSTVKGIIDSCHFHNIH